MLSVSVVVRFIFICVAQIVAGSWLARTDGFRHLGWTVACLGLYALSFWGMASLIRSGTPLSLLIPLMSAIIPISLIFIGVFVMGEGASLLKIGMLSAACVLVGLAAAAR